MEAIQPPRCILHLNRVNHQTHTHTHTHSQTEIHVQQTRDQALGWVDRRVEDVGVYSLEVSLVARLHQLSNIYLSFHVRSAL